jgi:hypothetical protein
MKTSLLSYQASVEKEIEQIRVDAERTDDVEVLELLGSQLAAFRRMKDRLEELAIQALVRLSAKGTQ